MEAIHESEGDITFAAVLGTLLAVGCSMAAFAENKGVVNANQINVRQSADTESEKLGLLFEGDEIDILSNEGNWYKINYNNQEAYVFSDYIIVSQAEGKVAADQVNVRSSASSQSDVVGTVNSGDTVTVVASNDSWYKIVRTNGDIAYVSKEFVDGEILDKVATDSSASQAEDTTVAAASALSASPVDSENNFTEVSNKYAAVTATSGLRVRSGAGTDFDVLTTLEYGDYVDVLAVSNDWIKVTDGNVTGLLVLSMFLSEMVKNLQGVLLHQKRDKLLLNMLSSL